jgi:SAM-dependent methyltransferase
MNELITSLGYQMIRFESRLKRATKEFINKLALNAYLRSDRRPWRLGYGAYRNKYLAESISDPSILEIFLKSKSLPPGYGFRLDARLVEIPWVLARVANRSGRLLDAGSSLNYDFVLTAPLLSNKTITIVTLSPEATCLWEKGVSYMFGDLRNLDFRDECFDTVVCISTIEHVGMDNTMYVGAVEMGQRGKPKDFVLAVKELKRMLKPDGVLYITFPFGEYEDHGWFQQFDSQLTDKLIEEFRPRNLNETVFRYDPDGWKLSDRASCAHCQFFDVHESKYFDPKSSVEYPPDFPAGERAVMCLALCK